MDWKTLRFYLGIVAGVSVLLAAVWVVPTRPIWLILFMPLILAWGIWILLGYWEWVRSLGR